MKVIRYGILEQPSSQSSASRQMRYVAYNDAPAHLMMYRNAAKNGMPRAAPRAQPLTRSMKNRPGVCLLKPYFSSRTKFW